MNIKAIFTTIFLISTAFSSTVLATDNNQFSMAQICKAGISKVMGREPNTMASKSIGKGIFQIGYIRPTDGKTFAYKCKIEKKRIIWGSISGRWRTHSADSVVTYEIKGNDIHVTDNFGDGSVSRIKYTLSELGS